ncbi:MAG: type II toxin-antitoxin system Phd/YefM family antitoxin [Rickettsiales bacterium]
MKQLSIHEAKTHLSRLVEEAAAGEEIVIAKAGKPVARLVALASGADRPRRPGSMRGKIEIRDDFDDPLPADMAQAFGADG